MGLSVTSEQGWLPDDPDNNKNKNKFTDPSVAASPVFRDVQHEVGFVTPVAEGFYEIPVFGFLSAVLSKFVLV